MSRSIHRTRRELTDLETAHVSDSENRAYRLAVLLEELRKKRRIKRQVRNLRHSNGELPPSPIESIPVQEFQASPHIHYPASSEDVRAVLRNLPGGVADGLEAVELRAGVEDQREFVAEEEDTESEPDPLTGRYGMELMPGVFTPPVLGYYLPARSLICLFAYVYDLEIANREIVEFYIRLQMLSTFVHEVAHHYDCTSRVERDRWRFDDYVKNEIYAESIQYDWQAKYVIPYLETSCADQAAQMQRWLQAHVGAEVPLQLLAGDPRSTSRNGSILTAMLYNTCRAFEELVTAVALEQPRDKIQIDFARNLHYAQEYSVPERILQFVLDENPKNVEAIALTADIAEHRGNDSLAVELAERALAIEKNDRDALMVLTYVYQRTSNWRRLYQSAQRLLDNESDGNPLDVIWALECCARARFHQGRTHDFELILTEIDSFGSRMADRSVKRLKGLESEQD